jgi:hypothetical protein
VRANGQAAAWRRTELANIVEEPIVISFDYTAFEDYWASFSTGPTRIAQRLTGLPAELRAEIERNVRAGYLAGMPDGPRSFVIIVRAVRGILPTVALTELHIPDRLYQVLRSPSADQHLDAHNQLPVRFER